MILEALESVNNSLSKKPLFFYADLNEANFHVDKLAASVAASPTPVNIVLPFTVVDNRGRSGILKSTFELQGFMLMSRQGQSTIDYNAKDVENDAIAPMRILAREFIWKLNLHKIIDPEGDGITISRFIPAWMRIYTASCIAHRCQ